MGPVRSRRSPNRSSRAPYLEHGGRSSPRLCQRHPITRQEDVMGGRELVLGGSHPNDWQHGLFGGEDQPEGGLHIMYDCVGGPAGTSWLCGLPSGTESTAGSGSDEPHVVSPREGDRRPKVRIPRDSRSPRSSPRPDRAEKQTFACPYHKWMPEVYPDCRRYKLSSVRYVVQHIKRKHTEQLFCASCRVVFGLPSSFQAHEKKFPHCEWREGPAPGFIALHHLGKVGDSKEAGVCRGKSAHEQWMDLWGTLFPGVDRPKSAHLESQRGELACQLYSFWIDHRKEIASEVAKEAHLTVASQSGEAVPLGIVDLVIQHFLALFGGTGTTTGQNGVLQSPTEISSQYSTTFDLDACSLQCDTAETYGLTTQGTLDAIELVDDRLSEPGFGILPDDNLFPAGSNPPWDAYFCSPPGSIRPSDLLVFPSTADFGSGDDPPLPATSWDPPPVIDLTGLD